MRIESADPDAGEPAWHPVHTAWNRERRVIEELEERGFQVACPLRTVGSAHRLRQVPLFRGYVFAQGPFDSDRELKLLGVPGVVARESRPLSSGELRMLFRLCSEDRIEEVIDLRGTGIEEPVGTPSESALRKDCITLRGERRKVVDVSPLGACLLRRTQRAPHGADG